MTVDIHDLNDPDDFDSIDDAEFSLDPRPELREIEMKRASNLMYWARRYQAELEEQRALYMQAIADLKERMEMRLAMHQRRVDRCEEPIKAFHLALLREDPKRKTLSFPHGESKIRQPEKPTMAIEDQEDLDAWVRANHPELLKGAGITAVGNLPEVRIQERDGAHVVLTSDGEIIPGLAAGIPERTQNVKPLDGVPL